MRRLGVPGVAVALAVALVACAQPPAARTAPNPVERAALAAAGDVFRPVGGTPPWIQLWTPAQMDDVVERCISRRTHGIVRADVLYVAGVIGINYDYGDLGGASADDIARFTTGPGLERVAGECFAATPVDDRVEHIATGRWKALYSYDVTVLRRCLIAHGQMVPLPPSRERFEALLRGQAPWSPYDHVVVRTRAEWYALSDACPALPPGLAVEP